MAKVLSLCLVMLTAVCLWPNTALAQYDTVSVKGDTSYDVYYQLSDTQVAVIENVRILGVETIGGVDFLAFEEYSELGVKIKGSKIGYVNIGNIRAILPDGMNPRIS